MRRAVAALALALGAGTAVAAIDVDFEVDLRAEIAAGRFDPAHDRVGLRGGWPPLAWDRSLPLAPRGDGRWAATVRFDAAPYGGQPVPNKFRIERAAADEGWEPGRNHAAFIGGASPRVARVFGAEEPPPPAHHAGTLVRLDALPSRNVAGPRAVWVWLPPGYDRDPSRRFPVLYLLDGQNVFDGREAGAEWQVDEAAQRLVLAGEAAPFIVVAVPSGHDRIDELTPTPDVAFGRRSGGGAAAYARFLLDELKPLVDARFRTRADAASTAVGGSSLGGLFSFWLALHSDARIGAALVVSPSVEWDDGFMLRQLRAAALPEGRRPRLWLDVGDAEGDDELRGVRRLRDALVARGWRGSDLAYTEAHGARHDELAWAARVPGMLKFLYGKPSPPPQERAP